MALEHWLLLPMSCCQFVISLIFPGIPVHVLTFYLSTKKNNKKTHIVASITLRKHAYSNILKMLPPKNAKFSDKKFWYFSYFCSKHRSWVLVRTPHWGSSNEYPQSMSLSRNKKNNVYPCKPQFCYKKSGVLMGSKLYRHVFVMMSWKAVLIGIHNKSLKRKESMYYQGLCF